MKIGITGGGYVGSILIEDLLKQGYSVRCLDNFSKGNCDHLFAHIKNYNGFEFQKGDINDQDDVIKFLNGVDFIFNTAAIVGAPACDKNKILAKITHSAGVRNLLVNRGLNCPLIQFSTDSCYGINSEFCNEDTELNPQSVYGKTKAYAEKIVLDFENTICLRFSTGMGVSNVMRCNLLVNDLTYKAVTEKKLELFEPDVSRSFINVKDMSLAAIHFMKLLVSGKSEHRIYNVGCDSLNYTKRELAEVISKKTNCDVKYIDGKDPDCRNYKISHDRQYETGFKPSVTMEETIETLIRAVSLIEWQRKYQ